MARTTFPDRRGTAAPAHRRSGPAPASSIVRADLALEQDEVLFQSVLSREKRLLLCLKLDLRAQFIEVGDDASLVGGVGVFIEQPVGRFQRFGVVHLTRGGDRAKIGCRHLLDDLAARRHFVEVGGALGRADGLPAGDHRTGEEHLAILNLALGQGVAGDLGEARGNLAAGKERQKHLDDAGTEAQRSQVMLMDARVAAERNGGQKVLQGFVLLTVKKFFAVFSYLQAQIVFQAASDGLIERELQRLVRGWPCGYTAEKGIDGRGRAGRLGDEHRRSRPPAPASPAPPAASRPAARQIVALVSTASILSDLRGDGRTRVPSHRPHVSQFQNRQGSLPEDKIRPFIY
jgi:hypothetical protein